jgi:hypothetical protein
MLRGIFDRLIVWGWHIDVLPRLDKRGCAGFMYSRHVGERKDVIVVELLSWSEDAMKVLLLVASSE